MCLPLPGAYRSLPRPSSAPDAKAFTLCSCSLELPSVNITDVLFELSEFHLNICFGFLFSEKATSFDASFLKLFPP